MIGYISEKNMEQGQRNLDVTTSSMDVMALNNLVVSMRASVKQSRVQIINKLTHQIRLYRKKKGSDEQVAKFQKKADRLKSEIDALKHINIDQAAKNALACSISFEEAAKEGNMERRAIARLASHKLLQPKVEKFRKEHDDWKSLTAFLLSKNTGRRFKKKKTKKTPTTDASTEKQTEHTEMGSESSDGSEREELEAEESDEPDDSDSGDDESVSPKAQLSRPECSSPSKSHSDLCPDSDDSQDDHMIIPLGSPTVLPPKSECRKAKPESVTPLRKTSKAKPEDSKQPASMLSDRTAAAVAASTNVNILKDKKSAKKDKLKRNINATTAKNVRMPQTTSEMVVQTLNLNELNSESDILLRPDFIVAKTEEDLSFLYTPATANESCTKKPKKKVNDPFFVGESGSEENETSSQDGDSGSEEIANETETQSLGRKISKNMVQSSFVDTLSRANSSRKREKQVSRRMHEEKQGKPNVGGKTFYHPIQNVGDTKRPTGKKIPRQRENSATGRRQLHPGGATAVERPEKEPETKLHPSWEASKKRKQQVAGVKAFCGKKIKFDDDS